MPNEEIYCSTPFHDGDSKNKNEQWISCQSNNLEDYMKENQMLKLKISELSTLIQMNEMSFGRRLGATEYELEQCKKANEDVLSQQTVKIQTLQAEVNFDILI
ncbi:unnamed protein product [Trichobilharzia regenti]|nr:unnamed protein product [Trichobilharzia regenti]